MRKGDIFIDDDKIKYEVIEVETVETDVGNMFERIVTKEVED